MADLQTQVPQEIKDEFDDGERGRGRLVRSDEQKIDGR